MLAGQGKSFVIFAVILLLLKFTKTPIHVLFENSYLLNRDKKRFELAMGSEEFKKRVSYHSSVEFIPEEESFTIIDECDKLIFDDSQNFVVKFKHTRCIGLTGTAVAAAEGTETAVADLVEEKHLKVLGIELFFCQDALERRKEADIDLSHLSSGEISE